jgi:hypothetical protein
MAYGIRVFDGLEDVVLGVELFELSRDEKTGEFQGG